MPKQRNSGATSAFGNDTAPAVSHSDRLLSSASQLHNFILDQVDYISKRQRSISRVLIPEVQAGMRPVYAGRKVHTWIQLGLSCAEFVNLDDVNYLMQSGYIHTVP